MSDDELLEKLANEYLWRNARDLSLEERLGIRSNYLAGWTAARANPTDQKERELRAKFEVMQDTLLKTIGELRAKLDRASFALEDISQRDAEFISAQFLIQIADRALKDIGGKQL